MSEPITWRNVTAADHLPECPWPDKECSHTPMQDRQPLFCLDCLTECICDELRACEQRVRDERNIAWSKELDKTWDDGMEVGTVSALDAARETLDALLHIDPCDCDSCRAITLAQAFIDDLRVQPAERAEDNLRGEQ